MATIGTGTAAIISAVGELKSKDWKIKFKNGGMGPVASEAYTTLTNIQYGKAPDLYNWITYV